MKYIIMCGGPRIIKQKYPDPLQTISGEVIVKRTIKLLRSCGVKVNDIAISSEDSRFKGLGVTVLKHSNCSNLKRKKYYWINCFYPTNKPTCYLMGDVYYSKEAIETIVNTETDDIEFFASAKPFDKYYIKQYAEPFAFKVQNVKRFWECVRKAKWYESHGYFKRGCISWELWQVIKGTPFNMIKRDYTVINDYTVDLHGEIERAILEKTLRDMRWGILFTLVHSEDGTLTDT